MAMKFPAIIGLLAALLCGCQSVVVRDAPQPVRVADGVMIDSTPLVEALLSQTGTVLQAVSGSWKDNAFAAEVVMKGDGQRLTAIFLAPQMRLATITLTRPHAIRYERAAQIPRMFEPEYALADLAFVNLDARTLRRAVAPALRVEDDGATRRIFAGDTLVADLTTNPDATRTFRNLVHGYTYTLKTLQ
jgi:hypothetical protein